MAIFPFECVLLWIDRLLGAIHRPLGADPPSIRGRITVYQGLHIVVSD